MALPNATLAPVSVMAATSSSTAARREVGGIGPSCLRPNSLARVPNCPCGFNRRRLRQTLLFAWVCHTTRAGGAAEERRHGGAIAAGHLPFGLHLFSSPL